MSANMSASPRTGYATSFKLEISAVLALLTAVVGLGLALIVAPRMERVDYTQQLSAQRIFDPGAGDFTLPPSYDLTVPGK